VNDDENIREMAGTALRLRTTTACDILQSNTISLPDQIHASSAYFEQLAR
jgi:hypothetical protein